ncbi:hypothetical protein XENTR_v10016062 [Xenopus tropicalis]|nr:hypothetical protein XENTR_v10016062 [Xenopus tropicalis]
MKKWTSNRETPPNIYLFYIGMCQLHSACCPFSKILTSISLPYLTMLFLSSSAAAIILALGQRKDRLEIFDMNR